MYHYTYYTYEEFGRGYIGSRTCAVPPEKDPYMGSYSDKTFSPTNKIVLGEFDSREQANDAEMKLQRFFSVVENPHFVNRSVQTSTSFSTTGLKMSAEWRQKRSEYAKQDCVFNRPDVREANNKRMREFNPMKNPEVVAKVLANRRDYSGAGNPNVKLTKEKCEQVRDMKSTKQFTNSELAEMFGVSVGTVKRVCRPTHWSNQ